MVEVFGSEPSYALDGDLLYAARDGAIWRRRLGTDEDLLWRAPQPGAQVVWVSDVRAAQALWAEFGTEGLQRWWRDADGHTRPLVGFSWQVSGKRLISSRLALFLVDEGGFIARLDGARSERLLAVEPDAWVAVDVEDGLAVFTVPAFGGG